MVQVKRMARAMVEDEGLDISIGKVMSCCYYCH